MEKLYFKKVLFALTLMVALVSGVLGSVIANAHADSEFKVIYSLDRKQNNREIIKLIDDADSYVYFAIYYFSRHDIADALIRAKKRGVVVWGIMDREASKDANKTVLAQLRAAGIPLETQRHLDGIMHMKVLVTDKAYASGSYNWTESATSQNDEVLEIGSNENVRQQYLAIVKKVLLANE
jgi:phosphatidylserine/phosphatidylglycerophosphate/cardiolipin synthase-like enzyme